MCSIWYEMLIKQYIYLKQNMKSLFKIASPKWA